MEKIRDSSKNQPNKNLTKKINLFGQAIYRLKKGLKRGVKRIFQKKMLAKLLMIILAIAMLFPLILPFLG